MLNEISRMLNEIDVQPDTRYLAQLYDAAAMTYRVGSVRIISPLDLFKVFPDDGQPKVRTNRRNNASAVCRLCSARVRQSEIVSTGKKTTIDIASEPDLGLKLRRTGVPDMNVLAEAGPKKNKAKQVNDDNLPVQNRPVPDCPGLIFASS
jgi:hypothetical protein